MNEGDSLPAITVMTPDGTPLALAAAPRPMVIYFYPKDDTSGCTREAQDFSALQKEFAAAGVSVIGISKDSPKSHAKFIAKHDLTVSLASDEDGTACEAFGVWKEKSMYGRTYMGIERATFLFDTDGKLVGKWSKVRVKDHAQTVLDAALAL